MLAHDYRVSVGQGGKGRKAAAAVEEEFLQNQGTEGADTLGD